MADDLGSDRSSPLNRDAVGFTTLQFSDSSRPFDSWTGPVDRPVWMNVWYPAEGPGTAAIQELTLADYYLASEIYGIAGGEATPETSLRERREILARRHSLSSDEIDQAMSAPFRGVRDAPRRPGKFPAILLFADPHSLAGFAESLAFEGYVVVAPSRVGTHSRNHLRFRPNPSSLDTDIDDLRFVYQQIQALDWMDVDRLGTCAFSSGSLSILLWQMQDLRAEAMVTIEGWEGFEEGAGRLEASTDYRPRANRVPWLQIEKVAEERSSKYAKTERVVRAMPFSDHERLRFPQAEHASFLTETRVISQIRGESEAIAIHDAAISGALEFFNRTLGRKPRRFPSSVHFIRTERPMITAVPTQSEIIRMIEQGQLERARKLVAASPRDPGVAFERSVMRRVASNFTDPEIRLGTYLWIAEVHKTSARAWVDIGNVYADREQPVQQREALLQALFLIPADPGLDDETRVGLTGEIESRIAILESAIRDE